MTLTLRGAAIHTGREVLPAGAVTIEGGRIASVETDASPIPAGAETLDLAGAILAPGFVDLMVNGGGGVTFNESPERLEEIVNAHRSLGTTSFLANFITDSPERMRVARAAVEKHAGNAVLGVHWEGPVLSDVRPGMHSLDRLACEFPTELARPAENLTTLVTLAPEIAGTDLIAQLVALGARVALGHTNATLEEFRAGVDAGATLVTHLYNGMRPFAGRDPGIIGGALSDDRVSVDVINDGRHVDFASIRMAWRAKPRGLCFFVTDAMSPVASSQTEFTAVGVHVRVHDGQLVTDAGGLGGSLLSMPEAVRNAVEHVGVPLEEAIRMASTYPARYLGVDDRVGVIAPGAVANLVVLDSTLALQRVMFEGEWAEVHRAD